MVKELRDKTGAGMMDCKKALSEAAGDMEAALEHLRKAGIAKAAKKASRSAKEGLIFINIADGAASAVEALCETDFVAKNEKFVAFANRVAAEAVGMDVDGDVSEALNAQFKDELTEMVAKIGENQQLRRAIRWQGAKYGSYLHMGGKIGVLVEVEGDADETLMNDICMHIAAFSPRFVDQDEITPEVIEKEKEIAAAQVEGKPANIIDKIVMGKINKWYSEVCLMKQPWLRDDKSCLAKIAPNLKVKRFIRWAVGEEL
jgi:elongation factor Ts